MTEAADPKWIDFRNTLEKAIGVPLYAYKEPQMKRRLATVMTRMGITTWPDFSKALARDRKLLDEVRDTLTINVTEFFRQADRFGELQTKVLPSLLKERPKLKLWSAGCSTGCEPYTLAMILAEVDPKGNHSITATDVDMPILAAARAGTGYRPDEVRGVPPALLKKYFVFDGTSYAVTDDIRRRVQFRRQDLLSDPYPTDLDLILCRNVVIYFNDEAKAKIYQGFSKAIRPGGYLFIGGSEMLIRPAELGLKSAAASMFQRAA